MASYEKYCREQYGKAKIWGNGMRIIMTYLLND
jgi:hypothetical protein